MKGSPEMRALAKTGAIAVIIALLIALSLYSPIYWLLSIVSAMLVGVFYMLYRALLDMEYLKERDK